MQNPLYIYSSCLFCLCISGLNESQLKYLADPATKSVKTSRRDFSYVMSQVKVYYDILS